MTPARALQAAVKHAKERVGPGWLILGDEFRSALVAKEMLRIIAINSENPGFEKAGQYADACLKNFGEKE